jgi:hypothetical protein
VHTTLQHGTTVLLGGKPSLVTESFGERFHETG